jgi:uncharacterized hydrophobic protein (TIGR00271 family)
MSPILGVGLGVAIQDRRLLINALKNLLLATIISLTASAVYFTVSPLGEATAEITARTTPTILDVAVAFFGGVAGIVAGSRRDKTNAIPGVAIATALMPPICVAGFGLAKMNLTVFLGAFYLYFINAVFIALATYLISVWLHFPKREFLDAEKRHRVKVFVISFAILVIIPSALIFFNVLDKLRFDKGVRDFVNQEIRNDYHQPIQWEVNKKTNPPNLKIYVVGKTITDAEKKSLREKMSLYGLGNLDLRLVQMNVSADEVTELTTGLESSLLDKFKFFESVNDQQRDEIKKLKAEVFRLKSETPSESLLAQDIKNIFPEIVRFTVQFISKPQEIQTDETISPTPPPDSTSNQGKIFLVAFQNEVEAEKRSEILTRVQNYLKKELDEENVKVIEYENSGE